MFTALRLGNFKAFADTQRLPIKPITLIFGPNSSGKSSLIHGLLLARHAQDTGELDVFRTIIGGESVDLGGFRQYVHRTNLENRVEWGAEINTEFLDMKLKEKLFPARQVYINLSIGVKLGERGELIPESIPSVMSYEIGADNQLLVRMSRRPDGNMRIDQLDYEHPVFKTVLDAMVATSTTTEGLSEADYEGVDEAISEMVHDIYVSPGKFIPDAIIKPESYLDYERSPLFTISKAHRKSDLKSAIRFFAPRYLDEIIQGLEKEIGRELSRLQYLGPLRSFPPRHLAFAQDHDPNWFAGGGYAWDIVRRKAQVREKVNHWLSSPAKLQTPYELIVRDLLAADQIEQPVWEAMEELDSDGLDILPDYDDEPTPSGAYPAIKDFEAEVARMVESIAKSNIDKFQDLALIDKRNNTKVSHRDVGIGISQVLPVLVSAYGLENKIVAIEQPEIHLHPALQAEIGDVFIGSALGEDRNTFIIESHSEHLLLRIMRRMRETVSGKLPKEMPPVRVNDIMVLYVEADGPRSIVREMPLNERGELVKAWPGGFFEEGLKEVF